MKKPINRYADEYKEENRYYAASDMHTSLAIKIVGYWVEKTPLGIQKGTILKDAWCVYDDEGCILTGNGFGQIQADDIDEYLNNPNNYPIINGKLLYAEDEAYFEKRRIKDRDQVLDRLNIASDEKIDISTIISWSIPASIIPFNIITSENKDVHREYLYKFNIEHEPFICSNDDHGIPSDKAFVIKELSEIRYLHYSKKTNKYFLITVDSDGKVKRDNGELSDTDASEEYIVAGINVSGKVAVSENHLSKYNWPDWKRDKLLHEDHSIINIWLIFDNIKYDKKRLISDNTFLTPFSDYDIYSLNDDNTSYRMLCANNDKHDLFMQVLNLDNREKKEYCGSLTVNNKSEIIFNKLIEPGNSHYNEVRRSFRANSGELVYTASISDGAIDKNEYDGFIINSISEKQICHLRKSGKYKVFNSNGELIREGMYLSKNERKDLRNHFLYVQDLFQAINTDIDA